MKLPLRFIFGGLSLLFLIALAFVLSRENIPWIGGLIIFIGLGAFPFYFFLFALFASSEPFPTYKQLGLPEPEALPEGVITVRFWTGNLANIPAAIVVDPQQDEILFIRCLEREGFFSRTLPSAKVSKKQVLDVWDYPDESGNVDARRLEIVTELGKAKIPSFRNSKENQPPNYDLLRDYLAHEFPGDSSSSGNQSHPKVFSNLAPSGKTTMRNYIVSPWKIVALVLPVSILGCTLIGFLWSNQNQTAGMINGALWGFIIGGKLSILAMHYNRL